MTENASRFPLFVDLTGRRCVIVGGGAIAARRAAVLSRFGAAVTVIAPIWTGDVPDVDWQARLYAPGDLKGASSPTCRFTDRSSVAATARKAPFRSPGA